MKNSRTLALYDVGQRLSVASRLQREGVGEFAQSGRAMLARIGEKSQRVASAVSA